jgi:hypothetical protein
MSEIIYGLQCSPFEARAVLEAVYKVYRPYFETSGHLKPGRILFSVISIDEGKGSSLLLTLAQIVAQFFHSYSQF